MTTQVLALTALNLVLAGVVLLVAVRLVRALRHTVELENRVTRLQEGVNLLSDATETGLRLVMTELERLSELASEPPPARTRGTSRPTAAGVRAAARRGETVQEIAARERVSEGEVRLRLTLAEATATREPREPRESTGIWGHGRLRTQ